MSGGEHAPQLLDVQEVADADVVRANVHACILHPVYECDGPAAAAPDSLDAELHGSQLQARPDGQDENVIIGVSENRS